MKNVLTESNGKPRTRVCQLLFLIFLFFGLEVSLEAQDSGFSQRLDSFIIDNTYTFQLESGRLVGSARSFLQQELKSSQFFVIGELHHRAEVPRFTSALLPLAAESGFRHLGLEIGPTSAAVLSSMVSDYGVDSLSGFYQRYDPDGASNPVPFFDYWEEAIMLEAALSKGFNLWGIDQEFLYAPGFLLDMFYEQGQAAEDDSRFQEAYKHAKDRYVSLMQDSTDQRYVRLLSDEGIHTFFAASAKKVPELQTVIDQIRESWKIYDYNLRSMYYPANNDRALLMKKQLAHHYQQALRQEELPKMILKIGSMHAGYGRSPNELFDLGNNLHELAAFNGSKSFNLNVSGQYSYQRDGTVVDRTQYVPEYAPFFKHEREDAWTVIHLTPIKQAIYNGQLKWKKKATWNPEDQAFWNLLMRFDALLLTSLTYARERTAERGE